LFFGGGFAAIQTYRQGVTHRQPSDDALTTNELLRRFRKNRPYWMTQ